MRSERPQETDLDLQEIRLDPMTIASFLGREAAEIAGRPGVYKIDVSDFKEPKVLEIEPAASSVALVRGLDRCGFGNIAYVSVEDGEEDQTVSVVFFSEQAGRVSWLEIKHVVGPVEEFICSSEINVPFEAHYL